MRYLVYRTLNSKKAHLWNERGYEHNSGDTYCRLWSTNGLTRRKYILASEPGDRHICTMCANVFKRSQESYQ